jgi:hypothetical protein
MVAKSRATAAWDFKKSDQVTVARCGAGSMPAWWRIRHQVEAPTRCPSLVSSPQMRR